MTAFVLDAWALLAWLQDEQPAASVVQKHLDNADRREVELHLSMINAGEVFYRLAKDRGRSAAMRFRAGLAAMPVHLHVPEADDIWRAAILKSRSRISYADGFAASLAQGFDATLITGDRDFGAIADLRVEWLKRAG